MMRWSFHATAGGSNRAEHAGVSLTRASFKKGYVPGAHVWYRFHAVCHQDIRKKYSFGDLHGHRCALLGRAMIALCFLTVPDFSAQPVAQAIRQSP
jgi:hypothetical protein